MRSIFALSAACLLAAACATPATTEAPRTTTSADAKDAPMVTGSRIPRERVGAENVKQIPRDSYEINHTVGSTPMGAGQVGRPGN
jgi:hypothetical protein